MAHGTSFTRESALTSSSRTPTPPTRLPANGKVAIRPIKDVARKLPPDHPLRVVILSEPDELDGDECFVKLTVWLRLLPRD